MEQGNQGKQRAGERVVWWGKGKERGEYKVARSSWDLRSCYANAARGRGEGGGGGTESKGAPGAKEKKAQDPVGAVSPNGSVQRALGCQPGGGWNILGVAGLQGLGTLGNGP